MKIKEIGAADGDEYHEVVFQIRQRNKHLLPQLLLEVSAPIMSRPHYTIEEVADLTANPEASDAVEKFLKDQGDKIQSYDMGPFGEYIRATAKISVWSELFNADFREFELNYDAFDDSLMEAPKRLTEILVVYQFP